MDGSRENFLDHLKVIERLESGFDVDGEVQASLIDGRTIENGRFKLRVDDNGQFRYRFSAEFDVIAEGNFTKCDAIATYWDHARTSEPTRRIMRRVSGYTRGSSTLALDFFLASEATLPLYSALKQGVHDLSDEQFNAGDGFIVFRIGSYSYKLRHEDLLEQSEFVVERLLSQPSGITVVYKFRISVP